MKPNAPGKTEAAGGAMQEPSDAVLVQRMSGGDADAFALLVNRHVGAVSAVARRLLGDDGEAEDVTQEALLKLWRLGAGLSIDGPGVRPWLRRVVSNMAIDRIRSRRRVDVTDDVPEVAEAPRQMQALEGNEVSVRVDVALQALPERQRLALTLFHFEGLSQMEVAAAMNVSDEAVESLLARARRSLKTALAGEWRDLLASDERV
ncbi:MAG: sigma-70 family RNA polymerase sigma factor [Hyphomicrobiaceae bacterium]|nr:sigma-70 family RNA polymerase sigma factor [Hyphomicrobiaceae bacterium]